MKNQKQMTVGETVITVQKSEDDDGNPCIFLMIEDEDGEVNLDFSPADISTLIELLQSHLP